ncbi:hypothetical protein [Bacteroides gallinarum]|nr:hypothetical protein [Bacteroides gallinarum]
MERLVLTGNSVFSAIVLLMPENIPGIRCKGLKNRRISIINLKKTRNNE